MEDSTEFPESILDVSPQWLSFQPNFLTKKILSIQQKTA